MLPIFLGGDGQLDPLCEEARIAVLDAFWSGGADGTPAMSSSLQHQQKMLSGHVDAGLYQLEQGKATCPVACHVCVSYLAT